MQDWFIIIMTKEISELKKSIDAWIKEVMSGIKGIDANWKVVNDNVSQITHNYELIYELKRQIDKIEEDLKALKLIILLQLKGKVQK